MKTPSDNFVNAPRSHKNLTECSGWNSRTCRARPRWELDDPQFLDDLFTQFIEGLRDSEHRQVACDSWKQGTSLTDLFMAVEDFERKRSLLSPKALSRTSCVLEYDSPAELEEGCAEEEGEIGAIFQRNGTKAKSVPYSKFN